MQAQIWMEPRWSKDQKRMQRSSHGHEVLAPSLFASAYDGLLLSHLSTDSVQSCTHQVIIAELARGACGAEISTQISTVVGI